MIEPVRIDHEAGRRRYDAIIRAFTEAMEVHRPMVEAGALLSQIGVSVPFDQRTGYPMKAIVRVETVHDLTPRKTHR